MVSIFFYFYPYLGKWSNLTNIFQMGWNHQLGNGRSQWGLDLHGGSRLPTPMLWGQVATFLSNHPPLGPLEGRLDVVTIETLGIWHSGASELSAQSCGVLAHKKCSGDDGWQVFSPIKQVEQKVWNHNFFMEMCERKYSLKLDSMLTF